MKRIFFRACIILFLAQLFTNNSIAQSTVKELQQTIHEKDSLFWNAYNNCDLPNFRKYIADDVEFYHDKGGITLGIEALAKSIRENLCEKKGFRLRRALVQGTLTIYPMEKNGVIYGAVISGDHDFFITENGKPEFHSGRAKFTHLWIYANNEWKMTRIFSYDHHAI